MPSAAQLLEQIGLDPDDDGLRLAYAQLLTAAGDPQGEFIRVQVELARRQAEGAVAQEPANTLKVAKPKSAAKSSSAKAKSAKPSDPLERLQSRASGLLRRHRRDWLQLVPDWARPEDAWQEFDRGFPDRVRTTVGAWKARGGALLARMPVHTLQIKDASPDFKKLAACATLDAVRILDLCYVAVGDAGLESLAQSKHLARLTGLLLFRAGIGPAGARALAESRHLQNLTWLSLEENQIQTVGAVALAESPFIGELRRLSLRSNRLEAAAGEALRRSRLLSRIERLRMGYMEIGPEGAAAILSASMPRLEYLEFDYNHATDVGAAALADANLPCLAELDLSFNNITAVGAKRLAGSKVLANVRRWRFANPLGGEGLAVLAKSRHLKQLVELDFAMGEIGDAGARALARTRNMPRLERLELSSTGIGPQGAIALVESPNLGGLTSLGLRDNPLDARSRQALRAKFGSRVRC